MIAVPMAATAAPSEIGVYSGGAYAPVTIPTATPYAVAPPSTAQAMQSPPLPTTVPLNAYVTGVSGPATQMTAASTSATTGGCGCGGNGVLRWYEIASVVALLVIAITALRKS
jgi:hypothetical protein